jgi:nucleotide-binding universal stress UspA family protein
MAAARAAAVPPRTILVPVELGDDAREPRRVAAALAGALGAELVLLGVAVTDMPTMTQSALGVPLGDLDLISEQSVIEQLVREHLGDMLTEVPAGVRARATLGWTPAGAAIVEAVETERADLVVVAIQPGSALEHLFGDHVQRFVLDHCTVPVLAVPPAAQPVPASRRR